MEYKLTVNQETSLISLLQGDYRGVAVQLCVRTTERAVHVLDPAQLSALYTQHVLPVIQELLLETPPLPTLALRIVLPLLSVIPEVCDRYVIIQTNRQTYRRADLEP